MKFLVTAATCTTIFFLTNLGCLRAEDPTPPTSSGGTVPHAESIYWPQFRGPNRDAISDSDGLLTQWPADGPPLIWHATGAGRGYSSLAIADGRLYTMGDHLKSESTSDEHLSAFDVKTGQRLWIARLGEAWDKGGNSWQSSRSTPTLDGSRIYALTAHADLICLESADGKEVWRRNLRDDFDGKKSEGWGYSESVLIDGDWLVCTPGGEEHTMVALEKNTGELVWSASVPENEGAGHSSIVISNIDGTKVYVQNTHSGPIGVRASDGELLWQYDIVDTTAVIPTPVIKGDLAFFTAGYGTGAALLRQVPDGNGGIDAEVVYSWIQKLQNKHGGAVLIGDYVYADKDSDATPYCAELVTGEEIWNERSSGSKSASIVAADGHLYLWCGDSTVALATASPEAYEEVGSFEVPSESNRPAWAHPVVAGGLLFVRHDGEIFCYDLRK